LSGTTDPGDKEPRAARFLTLQQVAAELNTRDSTIRTLIRTGELPAIQVGGRGQWRIERTKVEEYITAAYTRAAAAIRREDDDHDRTRSADCQDPDPPD
jgi:prophage regulatory protein